MSEQLKPCPFCGGAAERIDIEDGENAGGSVIACTVCQASSNVDFEFKENFVSNWNRRSSPIGGEEREKDECSQGLGGHPCGEQDEPTVEATAALADGDE